MQGKATIDFAHAVLLLFDAPAALARLRSHVHLPTPGAAVAAGAHMLDRREVQLATMVLQEGRLLAVGANKLDALSAEERAAVMAALRQQARSRRACAPCCSRRLVCAFALRRRFHRGPVAAARVPSGMFLRSQTEPCWPWRMQHTTCQLPADLKVSCVQVDTGLASWKDCITIQPMSGAMRAGVDDALQHISEKVPKWSTFVPRWQLSRWRQQVSQAGAHPPALSH